MKSNEPFPPPYAEHLKVLRRIEKKLDDVLAAADAQGVPRRGAAAGAMAGTVAGAFAGAAIATTITCIKQTQVL